MWRPVKQVVLEALRDDTGWCRICGVAEAEPPGSLSSDGPDGRQVYLFGWLPSGDGPGVWRSTGGADVANPTVRVVATTGFERLADLSEGPYTQDIQRPAGRREVRFRLDTEGER